MIKFTIEPFPSYLEHTIADIKSGEVVDYAISTMNLFARPGSLVEKFLDCLKSRGFKVYYDKVLTDHVYVLPDGHYVFRILPRGPRKNRIKHRSDEVSRQTKRKYADIMTNLGPRFFQIETDIPKSVIASEAKQSSHRSLITGWRKLRSLHLLQFLATSHLKVAAAVSRSGAKKVTISTGELSSDGHQSNLSLTLHSAAAHDFLTKKILNPDYQIGQQRYATCRVSPRLQLVADFGNYGAPLEIPQIHQLAEDLISDDAQDVWFLSQYNPSGRILKALNRAARAGANVTIPLQPVGDYRRRDGGFMFLFAKFRLVVSRRIHLPVRPHASHVKCLMVRHTDGSRSMIFGSDNLESWADTFYRNTELAAVITRARPSDPEFQIIETMHQTLIKTGEIVE
jgi:hypothetical protein